MRVICFLLTCCCSLSCTPSSVNETRGNQTNAHPSSIDIGITRVIDQFVGMDQSVEHSIDDATLDMVLDQAYDMQSVLIDEVQMMSQWSWRQGILGIDYQLELSDHSISHLAIRYEDELGLIHESLSDLRTHQDLTTTENIHNGRAIVAGPSLPPTALWISVVYNHGESTSWQLAQRIEAEPLPLDSPCTLMDPFQYCGDDLNCVLQTNEEPPRASCQTSLRTEINTAFAYFNESEQVFGFELKGVNAYGHHLSHVIMNFYDRNDQLIVGDIIEGYIERYTSTDAQGLLSISWSAPWIRDPQGVVSFASPSRATLFLVNDQDQKSTAIELNFASPRQIELGDPCDRLSALNLCPHDSICLGRCTLPDQLNAECPPEMQPHLLDYASSEYQNDLNEATYQSPLFCNTWGPTQIYQFTALEDNLYSFYTIGERSPLKISSRSHCAYPWYETDCRSLICYERSLIDVRLAAGETTYLLVSSLYGEAPQSYTLHYEVIDDDDFVVFCH